jgi:hypothetical protein
VQEIKEQVKRVLEYSQGLTDINIDYHMDNWKINKSNFYSALGHKYIYEYPEEVTFHLCQEARNKRLGQFIDYLFDTDRTDLGFFLSRNNSTFFDNKTENDYLINGEKIVAGSKIIKAFKYFIKDPVELDDLQTQASKIIQEDKITGTFCISIHPLDYLSSSENNYKWRSCHALDGEYRCGNLSYMMDSCTLVCYIKGKDSVKLPRFPEDVPWNDKKWRMLLHVSEDHMMLFAGRQYPFAATSILDFINKLLNNSVNNRFIKWSPWSDKRLCSFDLDSEVALNFRPLYPAGTHFLPITEIVEDAENAQHFNDLLRSSCYIPYYSIRLDPLCGNNTHVYSFHDYIPHLLVGHENRCLLCGCVLSSDDEYMVCEDCADKYNTEDD